MFFSERRRGSPGSPDTWRQLGLSGIWERAPIVPHIREAKSGIGQFFGEFVLLGEKDQNLVIVELGAASVVNAIMKNHYAVGYSGIDYRTNSVKPLRRELTNRHMTF